CMAPNDKLSQLIEQRGVCLLWREAGYSRPYIVMGDSWHKQPCGRLLHTAIAMPREKLAIDAPGETAPVTQLRRGPAARCAATQPPPSGRVALLLAGCHPRGRLDCRQARVFDLDDFGAPRPKGLDHGRDSGEAEICDHEVNPRNAAHAPTKAP